MTLLTVIAAMRMLPFATPVLAEGAGLITANSSGSLLGTVATSDRIAAATGALTLATFDAPAPLYTSAETFVVAPDSSSRSLAVAETNYYPQPAIYPSNDWRTAGALSTDQEFVAFGNVTPVPEPSTWLAALLAAGAALFVGRRQIVRRSVVPIENR